MSRLRNWYQSTLNGPIHVTEKWNKKGALLERILNFEDRTETSIDRDGDGFLDEWEFFSNDLNVRMSEPYRGNFLLMDVEKTRARDIVRMQLRRMQTGEYRVLTQVNVPRLTQFSESGLDDDVVAGMCRESEAVIDRNAIAMNRQIHTNGMTDQELDDIVSREIMHPECMQGEFGKKKKEMLEGIRNVFKSDQNYDSADATIATKNANKTFYDGELAKDKAGGARAPAKQGTYLACLRQYELDTHASRIESALHAYKLATHRYAWRIGCSTSSGAPFGKAKKGSAVRDGQYPLISFHREGCANKPGNCDSSAKEFGDTFFHEMLHYSGMRHDHTENDLVGDLEQCCTQTDPGIDACKSLRKKVEIQKDAQRLKRRIITNLLDRGANKETLEGLQGMCGELLGQRSCEENFQGFTRDYARRMNAVQDADPRCVVPQGVKPPVDCIERYKAELDASLGAYYGTSRCIAEHPAGYTDDEKRERCEYFGQKIREVLKAKTGSAPADGGYCFKKQKLFSIFCPKPLQLLYTPAVALAAESNFCENAAKVTGGIKWKDFDTEDYRVWELTGDPKSSSRSHIEDMINTVGTKGPKLDTETSSTIGKNAADARNSYDSSFTGPKRPDYSDTASLRAKQIEFDLRRQNNFGDRVEKYVDVAFQQWIPSAKARGEGKDSLNTDPAFSLPDPLSREVSKLAGPSSVKSASYERASTARGPASEKEAAKVGGEAGGKSSGEGRGGNSGGSGAGAASGGGAKGLGPSGGGQGAGGKASDKPALPEDPTAREALITFLTSIEDVQVLRGELRRQSTRKSLERHMVAVIDDKGKRHPLESEARYWLIFNHAQGKLTRMREASR